METQAYPTQEEFNALAERVTQLEQQIDFLVNFSVVDPEIVGYLLSFWFTSFILAHAAGRVARAMGK